MFGKNPIIGKKFFENADGKYLVTSMFYTIQGEGPYAGKPAFFIRLAHCNLNCSFCDTYFSSGQWLTLDEIDDKIEKTLLKYFNNDIPDWVQDRQMVLVLTGGEPSLQNLKPLLEYFSDFKYTQIESNGILPIDLPETTTLVVSPKCVEKKGVAIKYIEPLNDVKMRADCMKFVITSDETSLYHTIPDWAFEWKKDTGGEIYISPMNMYNREPKAAKMLRGNGETTLEERSMIDEVISFWEPGLLDLAANEANHAWAADYAMKHGFRVNLQMHLYLGKA